MSNLLCAAALGLLALALAPVFALLGSADPESAFLETRSLAPEAAYVDSAPPVLDPRGQLTASGYADSASFVLDTRAYSDLWTVR